MNSGYKKKVVKPIQANFYLDRKGFMTKSGKSWGFFSLMYTGDDKPERVLLMLEDEQLYKAVTIPCTIEGEATYWRTNTDDKGKDTRVFWGDKLAVLEYDEDEI